MHDLRYIYNICTFKWIQRCSILFTFKVSPIFYAIFIHSFVHIDTDFVWTACEHWIAWKSFSFGNFPICFYCPLKHTCTHAHRTEVKSMLKSSTEHIVRSGRVGPIQFPTGHSMGIIYNFEFKATHTHLTELHFARFLFVSNGHWNYERERI